MMKNNKKHILSAFSKIFAISFIFFANCLLIAAQSSEDPANNQLPLPAEEIFEEIDALASPLRVGDCPDPIYKMTNCHSIKETVAFRLHWTSLYNEDGSLWYTYNNLSYHSDFYKKNTTMDFLPFASYGGFQSNAILRMVGESENWYEVEVNEKTRATKFIAKNDSHWEKTSWDFWFAKMRAISSVDEENETKMYDKPNGNVFIWGVTESSPQCFLYLGKTEGDWAYVQARRGKLCYPLESKNGQGYKGWIQWRDGRKILVKDRGQIFNITEIKTDSKN